MNTQRKQLDDTGTEAQETSGPAGVGELATQVVISSSGNAKMKMETVQLDIDDTDIVINRNCYSVPLRLRGGCDDESIMDVTESNNRSGDMGASGSQKRGPPSPGGQVAKQPRTKQTNEMSDLIGWIEQTVIQEKDKKKIGVQVVEKMLVKINRLRSVTQSLAQENHRLAGELKGRTRPSNKASHGIY